jgi:hypothetical protein
MFPVEQAARARACTTSVLPSTATERGKTMSMQQAATRLYRITENDEFWARLGIGLFLAALVFQSARDAVSYFG